MLSLDEPTVLFHIYHNLCNEIIKKYWNLRYNELTTEETLNVVFTMRKYYW
jgi:hypothetical protein